MRQPLHSYLGSCVKAWKPALEATRRRMAWKWLSSSALRAGSSASWDKSARMALLMSFSLFSEKRPWRENRKKRQRNECESCSGRWMDINHAGLEHTHILGYCMQHSTVGYVGVESEHCICKVAIWQRKEGWKNYTKAYMSPLSQINSL